MQSTEWRPVVGYESYYNVSSDGRVWSHRSRRELRDFPGAKGYRRVALTVNSVSKFFYVHQIVATAFHGPCPEGMETRHLDGDQFNNRADNLKWGTRSQNTLDQIRHGTFSYHPNQNAGKAICKWGHPLTGDNVRIMRSGSRRCKQCGREARSRAQSKILPTTADQLN